MPSLTSYLTASPERWRQGSAKKTIHWSWESVGKNSGRVLSMSFLMENSGKEHILSHSLSIFFFLISFSHKTFNKFLCPEQPSPAPFYPIKNPEEWQIVLQAPSEVWVTPGWTCRIQGSLRMTSLSPVHPLKSHEKFSYRRKKKATLLKLGQNELSLERPHKSRKMVQMNLFSGQEQT